MKVNNITHQLEVVDYENDLRTIIDKEHSRTVGKSVNRKQEMLTKSFTHCNDKDSLTSIN